MKLKFISKNNINIFISSLGAFLCMFLIAYFNSIDETNIWLIPPFGASLVLVMAVHDSPLAKPRNVFFWSCSFCIIRSVNVLSPWRFTIIYILGRSFSNNVNVAYKDNSSSSRSKPGNSNFGG